MDIRTAEQLLTALREPAALLDGDGRILAINAGFADFAGDGALAGPRFAPGSSYVQAAADARHDALVQAIGEVLAGRSASFTHAYECGARCFELVVGAVGGEASGALLVQYEVTEQRRSEQARRDAERRLQHLIDVMPDGYWDWNIVTGEVYYSPRWGEALGFAAEEIAPTIDSWLSLVHPDDFKRIQGLLDAYWTSREGMYLAEARYRTKDGSYRWSLDQGRVIEWTEDGKPLRMVGIDINIHQRKLDELALAEQTRRLVEMSTPLIPISDDVVVMPLIGAIDRDRAQQILSSVLEGVGQRRAKVAILDLTGVGDMNTEIAAALVDVARAVQLLGARVILTGIRPEIATLLVGLDIDWGSVTVRGTLQAGIAEATARGRG